jgi:hypothetical protein
MCIHEYVVYATQCIKSSSSSGYRHASLCMESFRLNACAYMRFLCIKHANQIRMRQADTDK